MPGGLQTLSNDAFIAVMGNLEHRLMVCDSL